MWVLFAISARWFGQICPQDRATALYWSADLASISNDFDGGRKSREAEIVSFGAMHELYDDNKSRLLN